MEATQKIKTYPFLQGGGEMGELIRSFNWSQSSVGLPDEWPQSLRSTVSNILRSKFPMFLWWGKDMIQFYNDAYRPSLGNEGKHPSALGAKGADTWAEIWDIISPLHRQVESTGEATWMENQLVPIYRNGKLEDVYWTFSYSSVLDDDGNHGGILVTCMETTETVKAQKQVQKSEARFRSLFETMDQGFSIIEMIFDEEGRPVDSLFLEMNSVFEQQSGFKGAVGKRIREIVPEIEDKWFEVYGKVALTGEAIRFTDGSEVLGRWFDIYAYPTGEIGSRHVAVLFTDITVQTQSRKLLEESEARFRNAIEQSPVAIGLTRGEDFIFDSINAPMLQIINKRDKQEVISKPLSEVLPELVNQPVFSILQNVLQTGETFNGTEVEAELALDGVLQRRYFNITYSRVVDKDGIPSVLHMASDVTEQVLARVKREESETKYRTLFESMDQGYCTLEIIFEGNKCVDYRYLETNPNFERHLGMGNALGKTIREIAPDIEPKWFDFYGSVALTGIPIRIEEESKAFNKWFEVFAIRIGRAEERKVGVFFTDVTERKASEQLLKDNQELLRTVFDAAPNSLTVFEEIYNGEGEIEDFKFIIVNEFTIRTTGKVDLVGKHYAQEFPHVRETGVLDKFRNVAISGIPADFERWYEGESMRHWFRFIVNKVGKLLVVTTEDITERKEAERTIVESEERFRSMADASPVMIWTLDAQGNSTYYNKTAIDFTGHAEQELKEGTSWQIAIHPDDIVFAGGVVSNAVQNRQPYQMECRMRSADGDWRWLLSHGTPRLDKNNTLLGYVGSSVDISELKKSQQELQTALEQVRLSKEAAELGTFDMDLEKGTMHWDDRCRILFGISHHDAVTYENDFVKGLHPDDRERILKVIKKSFNKPISNGDYDVEYRTVGAEDGIIRWVRAKGKVYFNEQENPVRFIGSVLDITEKVMAIQRIESLVEERTRELADANERLQAINRELQRSNSNLEEFAHAASHDLKEPVRKIHFFTTQLKEQLSTHLAETEIRAFNRIESASERMRNLIDDLLLYSHVSQRPLEKESVDLYKKVQNALEELELDIEEKKATIHVGNLPVVKGYRRQLQQLFQNLISNAVKYSKDDVPPQITITSDQVQMNGKLYHSIEVADNGIGFDPKYADKIFQMFTRLHGKAEYSGTGVGLSIVKKVVENHNGLIQVESKIGKGSVFKIYLPI